MDNYKIYVDFDDVIVETARDLARLVFKIYGRKVDYESIMHFDLRDSFALSERDYHNFMERAHSLEVLLGIEETPGACETLRAWLDDGLQPVIVTGRPPSCHAGTRGWLDARRLRDLPVLHLDKYNRKFAEPEVTPAAPMLTMDDIKPMGFRLAIDDAPAALHLLEEHNLCPAVVFDRPWNRNKCCGNNVIKRVRDWDELDEVVRNFFV